MAASVGAAALARGRAGNGGECGQLGAGAGLHAGRPAQGRLPGLALEGERALVARRTGWPARGQGIPRAGCAAPATAALGSLIWKQGLPTPQTRERAAGPLSAHGSVEPLAPTSRPVRSAWTDRGAG